MTGVFNFNRTKIFQNAAVGIAVAGFLIGTTLCFQVGDVVSPPFTTRKVVLTELTYWIYMFPVFAGTLKIGHTLLQFAYFSIGDQRALVVSSSGVRVPKLMSDEMSWDSIDTIKMNVWGNFWYRTIPMGIWGGRLASGELLLYLNGPYTRRSWLTHLLFPKKEIRLRLKLVDAQADEISSVIRESEAQHNFG